MTSQVFNQDCMIAMREFPDKHFDLAVVDPPYGINIGKNGKVGGDKPFGSKNTIQHGVGLGIVKAKEYKAFNDSAIPNENYFKELFRVSKNQIIWGGNYFIEHLRNTQGFIVWDKDKSGFFADCEMAWTSFDSAARLFKWRWNGMLQEKMAFKETRIHPTQKPVALYDWLYKNYLPKGGKVIDTHLGSGSNRIAAHRTGNIDFYGYEIDKDYFEAQEKRFKNYLAQGVLFA